jgi:anti-sigma regulatory factor (Ser/Thr protein kinase)
MQAQPMQRVDLKSLCEDILQRTWTPPRPSGIDLGLDAQPVQVMGHEWLLRELLSNLVDNAVKYTPEGGTVTIRCGRRGEGAFLEVEDDGPGVPPQERGRVLERFYRVQGTGGEGNGLGLAIAQEIARVHHSQLDGCWQVGLAGPWLESDARVPCRCSFAAWAASGRQAPRGGRNPRSRMREWPQPLTWFFAEHSMSHAELDTPESTPRGESAPPPRCASAPSRASAGCRSCRRWP